MKGEIFSPLQRTGIIASLFIFFIIKARTVSARFFVRRPNS
jgi:hypothetical protein